MAAGTGSTRTEVEVTTCVTRTREPLAMASSAVAESEMRSPWRVIATSPRPPCGIASTTAPSEPTANAAAQAEVDDALSLGGSGGVIVMDSQGRPSFAMTTSGMYRGSISSDGQAGVAIYGDEDLRP